VTWTGACENGVGTGPGILTWDTEERGEYRWKLEARGSLRDGKQHGHWVERNDPNSILYPRTDKGPYVDGKRHGRWVERFDHGAMDEGPYVDGLMHGRWLHRSYDGDSHQRVYVRGEAQD